MSISLYTTLDLSYIIKVPVFKTRLSSKIILGLLKKGKNTQTIPFVTINNTNVANKVVNSYLATAKTKIFDRSYRHNLIIIGNNGHHYSSFIKLYH